MKRQRGLLLLAACLTVSGLPLGLWSERLIFTTSYPSPAGVYQQMLTTGGNPANPVNTVLARDAGNVLLALAAGGRVGVGTMNPAAKLDVTGNMRIIGALTYRDGSQGMSRVLTSDANGLASWQPGGGIRYYHVPGVRFTGGIAMQVNSPKALVGEVPCFVGAGGSNNQNAQRITWSGTPFSVVHGVFYTAPGVTDRVNISDVTTTGFTADYGPDRPDACGRTFYLVVGE